MPSFTDVETWRPDFSRKLHVRRFTRQQTEKVIVFSDYSAGAEGGKYDAYSYGFVTPASVVSWNSQRTKWRSKWFFDTRRMEWKSLADRIRWKALPSFLEIATTLNGWCITILVDRGIGPVAVHRDDFDDGVRSGSFAARWSFKDFEQSFRKCLFLILITAEIVPTTTKLTWLTDEDQFIAGDPRRTDVLKILTLLSNHFRGENSGTSELGDTKLDQDDRAMEDLIAMADLSAGSLLEAANASDLTSSQVCQLQDITDTVRERCRLILQWRCNTGGMLRHRCVVFMQGNTGALSIHNIIPLC
jgi:hypothetical protein